ncbi:MAG: nitroreductase family protein [Elusimicrobiota bacterium]|jgi:nitroreductase
MKKLVELQAIAERHSTRSFDGRAIPKEMLEKIVDAGRLATTARNEQPWEFVVVTDPKRRQEVAAITEYGKFIAQAAACVAVFCRQTKYYLEDGCAATENILIAAAALGVQSCWVAGDKKTYTTDIAKLLQVPDGYNLVSLIALGYEASPVTRPPKRPLPDVLHWEKF